MQAVISCGGYGTRLLPLTKNTPKPMIQIQDKPFLEWQMEYLKRYEVDEVVLLIGHLGDQIRDYFGKRKEGIDIKYMRDYHLDVYGAVKNAESLLNEKFLLIYGDSYPVNLNVSRFWNSFWSTSADMLIAAWVNNDKIDDSNLKVEEAGGEEKLVSVDGNDSNAIDVGCTVLSKNALSLIPEGEPFSTSDMRRVMFESERLDIYLTDGRFYHIGNHEGLEEVRNLIGEKT